ncbi:ankyrin repeat domain family member sosondowah isoform X2 [Lycorma delicatula]|uniref:ankyrin repeat domain family member sosondowah isoform X2 n=1 Tax=Lycorma delicatula TaxID=130591 RepID=UPI003F51004F
MFAFLAEARNEFKEIVNTLATIVRSDEGEKYLVLKKRYRNSENLPQASSPSVTPEPALAGVSGSSSVYPRRGSSTSSLSNFSTSQDSLEQFFTPTNRQPPPYRPPPPPVSPSSLSSPSVQPHHIVNYNSSIPPTSAPTSPASSPSITSLSNYSDQQYIPTSPSDTPRSPSSSSSTDPPPVPPRRKSSEKIKMDNSNKENVIDINKRPKTIGAESNEDISVDQDSKISVKECMQKFNRLASETALQKTQLPSGSNINNKKKSGKETPDRDEEDSVSLTSLGPKGKEWLIKACQCDYHALAKLSSENHLLPRLKDHR